MLRTFISSIICCKSPSPPFCDLRSALIPRKSCTTCTVPSFLRTVEPLAAHSQVDSRMDPFFRSFTTSVCIISRCSGLFCRMGVSYGLTLESLSNSRMSTPLHAGTLLGFTANTSMYSLGMPINVPFSLGLSCPKLASPRSTLGAALGISAISLPLLLYFGGLRLSFFLSPRRAWGLSVFSESGLMSDFMRSRS